MKKKPKKKKFTKAESIKIHAQKRKEERCPDASYSEIKKMICTGEAKLVKRQSRRVSHHSVVVKDKKIIAVYDHKRKLIVTLLYPGGKDADPNPATTE